MQLVFETEASQHNHKNTPRKVFFIHGRVDVVSCKNPRPRPGPGLEPTFFKNLTSFIKMKIIHGPLIQKIFLIVQLFFVCEYLFEKN